MNFIVDEYGTYFKEVRKGVYVPEEGSIKHIEKEVKVKVKETNYNLLEKAILDCIINKPELLKDTKLEEKYFKKYKRLFRFVKVCYEKFGSLDITLMKSVCPTDENASDLIDYVANVIDANHYSARYEQYETRLLEMYEDYETIEELYKLTKRLYIRDINLDQYKTLMKNILGE